MWLLNCSNLVDPLLKNLRIFVVKFAEVKTENRILDVCCATGDQVFHYAKIGAIATGIDSNPKMIEIAARKQKSQRIDNVCFQVADATDLPFEDSTFDIASISLALHEIEKGERDKVISEMKRVVKKDGSLVFTDFKAPLPSTKVAFLIMAIEYSAGKKHYENFKNYLQEGGLPILLQKNKLKEEKIDYPQDGLLMVIKTKNNF